MKKKVGNSNNRQQEINNLGFTVYNNPDKLRSYHYHSSQIRNYNSKNLLDLPFAYSDPIVDNLTKNQDFLNDTNLFWQYPVITEKEFYIFDEELQIKNNMIARFFSPILLLFLSRCFLPILNLHTAVTASASSEFGLKSNLSTRRRHKIREQARSVSIQLSGGEATAAIEEKSSSRASSLLLPIGTTVPGQARGR